MPRRVTQSSGGIGLGTHITLTSAATGGADEVSQTNVLQSVGKKGSSQSAQAYLKQAKSVRRGSTITSGSGGGGGDDDSDEGGTADEDQKAQAEAKAKKAFVKSKASKKSKKEARIKRPGMDAVSVLMEKSLVQARMRHKFTTAAMEEHGYNIDRGLFFGEYPGRVGERRPSCRGDGCCGPTLGRYPVEHGVLRRPLDEHHAWYGRSSVAGRVFLAAAVRHGPHVC